VYSSHGYATGANGALQWLEYHVKGPDRAEVAEHLKADLEASALVSRVEVLHLKAGRNARIRKPSRPAQ
jgi:hypothetical protein